MWKVTIANTSSSNNLNLFNSSNLNINLPFFRANTRLRPTTDTNIINPLPVIQDPVNTLEPIETGFIVKVEGLWTVLGYSQKFSLTDISIGSYFWREDTTYIFTSNLTTPLNLTQDFIGKVTSLLSFGEFEYTVIDVKVGGISVNFNQVNSVVIPQFISTDPCRPRLGNNLKVTYLRTLVLNTNDYQKVFIFDKSSLKVRTVTLYSYKGNNYFISNTLDSFTLLNLSNKKFLIIQP